MAIKSETRLGPYEIVSPIGAGGMGEVYRARDTRLKREVAIKVLPESFSADPQRLHRFEQEAIAAGALNHPNILAVHDIGTQDGSPYIVSELLDGATLRERLRSGPLPVRKAVEYAQQIATGLAAAHDKGIVHRDLKPENIFITNDGRVKILDFGLAKLTRSEGSEDQTQTIQSDAGTVLGTVGYMSPEQVRGKPADARSDLFSFGAILYEMLSGKRAFHGESAAETMSAILKEEPPELTETNRNVPPALERMARHCLEKNPQERFQSARDLVFDLESVTATSTTTKVPQVTYRRPWRAVVGTAVLVLLVLAGVLLDRVWIRSRSLQPSFRRLTFRRGSVRMARFAPDGETIIYGAAWDGNPIELFTMRYDSSDSRPLGVGRAQILSISKKGEIALLLNPMNVGFIQVGTLARMPLNGGAPRELFDMVQFAEFAPDGNSLALVRLNVPVLANAQTSGRSSVEYPAGKVIYQSDTWIGHLRVSPDNQFLAFAEHIPGGDDGRIVTIDRNGNKKYESQLFSTVQGVAWHPDGKELWFTAASIGGSRSLYAVNLSGKQRLVLRTPVSLMLLDIAPNGRVLLASVNARQRTFALAPGETKERNISWFDWSTVDALSEDGKTVVFDESGEATAISTIYLRRTDGSPAVRIGEGGWADLSPDGKWIIGQDTSKPPQLTLWPTGVGEPRQVTHDSLYHVIPRFVPDGKGIVFSARALQSGTRTYFQLLDGGSPVAVTPEGSAISPTGSPVSPDGNYVVAPGATTGFAIYPLHGGQSRPVLGLEAMDVVSSWSSDGKYLFTFRRGELPIQTFRVEIATGKRQLFKRISPDDPAGIESVDRLRITRDGKAYAYSCLTELSDLYVVDGLR